MNPPGFVTAAQNDLLDIAPGHRAELERRVFDLQQAERDRLAGASVDGDGAAAADGFSFAAGFVGFAGFGDGEAGAEGDAGGEAAEAGVAPLLRPLAGVVPLLGWWLRVMGVVPPTSVTCFWARLLTGRTKRPV